MTQARKLSVISGLLVAVLVFGFDQWSKWYMMVVMDLPNRPPIEVNSYFNLVTVWNQGVSFGMFASHNQPQILIALASVITLILLIWLSRNESKIVALALGLAIGGATGNIIDRIKFGKVFDFLDFHISGWHWPAFNIADCGVVIGVVLLCIHSMFFEAHNTRKGSSNEASV